MFKNYLLKLLRQFYLNFHIIKHVIELRKGNILRVCILVVRIHFFIVFFLIQRKSLPHHLIFLRFVLITFVCYLFYSFKNIVEISRAEIERSGSFPYHMNKIIDLTIVSSFKCHDIDRLVTTMYSLLTLKNEKNVP